MQGGFGNRLRNEIDWKEGVFKQYGKRCAFLNEDNLCDIYLEGGETMFCRTCRMYPRHVEEFEGLREISLSLSCPVAAEMILGCKEPVHFLHAVNPEVTEEYPDFDFFLFTKLMDARTVIFQILQNRKKPLKLRLAVILALSHDLQERIDKHALFQIDKLLERYSGPHMWEWFSEKLKKYENQGEIRRKTIGSLFVILNHLEVLCDDWKVHIKDARQIILDEEEKEMTFERMQSVFTDIIGEQIMAYFIFTYFCGAVYDGKAYGKMKFAFAGLIFIRELVRAAYIQNKEELEFSDVLAVARRYAREVEHSDFNKSKMEMMLENEGNLGLEALFTVL